MSVKFYQPYTPAHSSFIREYHTELTPEFKKNIEKVPELVELSNLYKKYLAEFVENGLRYDENIFSKYENLFKNLDKNFITPGIKEKVKNIVMDNVKEMFLLSKDNELWDMRNGSFLDNQGNRHYTIENLSDQEKSLSYNTFNLELRIISKILSALCVSDISVNFNENKFEQSLNEIVQDMGIEKTYEDSEEKKIENIYNKKIGTLYSHIKIEDLESMKILIKKIFSSLSSLEIDVFVPLFNSMIYSNDDCLFNVENLYEKKSFKGDAQCRFLQLLDKEIFTSQENKWLSFYLRKKSGIESILYHFSRLILPTLDEYEAKIKTSDSYEALLFNTTKMFEEVLRETSIDVKNYIWILKKQWLVNTGAFNNEEIEIITKPKNLEYLINMDNFHLLFKIKKLNTNIKIDEKAMVFILSVDEEDVILKKIENIKDLDTLLTEEYHSIMKLNKDVNFFTVVEESRLSYEYKELLLIDKEECSKVIDKWVENISLFKERIKCYINNVSNIHTFLGKKPEGVILFENIDSCEKFISSFKDICLFKEYTSSEERFFNLLLDRRVSKNHEMIFFFHKLFMSVNHSRNHYDIYGLLLKNNKLSIQDKHKIAESLLLCHIYPAIENSKNPQTLNILLSVDSVSYAEIDMLFSILDKSKQKYNFCDLLNNYNKEEVNFHYNYDLCLRYKSEDKIEDILKKSIYVHERYNVSFINEETQKSALFMLNDYPEMSECMLTLGVPESTMLAYHEESKIYHAFYELNIDQMLFYIKNGLKIDDSFIYTCDKKVYELLFDIDYKYQGEIYKITSEQWQEIFKDISIPMIEKTYKITDKSNYRPDDEKCYEENLFTLLVANNSIGRFDNILRHIIVDLKYVCPISEDRMTRTLSERNRRNLVEWENERQRKDLHSLINEPSVEKIVKRI